MNHFVRTDVGGRFECSCRGGDRRRSQFQHGETLPRGNGQLLAVATSQHSPDREPPLQRGNASHHKVAEGHFKEVSIRVFDS